MLANIHGWIKNIVIIQSRPENKIQKKSLWLRVSIHFLFDYAWL